MPPDPEDLNRQLEALQRYLDRRLADQRERGEEAVARPAPEARRPPGRWLLATGLLVVVALVGGLVVGAVAWSDDRPARTAATATGPAASEPDAGAAPAGVVATPACKTAVDRANAMLASAVKLREALATQDRALNDPAVRERSVSELLDRLAASQQVGASESARFDRALDAYRQVVDQCDLHAP